MTEKMLRLIEKRISSPNNAKKEFLEVLEEIGIEIVRDGNKSYALINNKKYGVVVTSGQDSHIRYRQFSSKFSGVITFWEGSGCIYKIDRSDLNITGLTREYLGDKYYDCKSVQALSELYPMDDTDNVLLEEYQLIFMGLARKAHTHLMNAYKKRIKMI